MMCTRPGMWIRCVMVGSHLQRNILEHLQFRDHQGYSGDRLWEEPYRRTCLPTVDCHLDVT